MDSPAIEGGAFEEEAWCRAAARLPKRLFEKSHFNQHGLLPEGQQAL